MKKIKPTKLIPAWIRRLLVTWGWMEAHLVYKGHLCSPFPTEGRQEILKEYLRIRLRSSKLSSKKRSFVVNLVEDWLIENGIDPRTYSNELLHFETGTPARYKPLDS